MEAREVKGGKIKRFRAPVFIDATGMAGWVIGRADYRMVVKQLPSIMKDGISTVNFGVRRKRIIGLWEPVYCGIVNDHQRQDFPEVPWAMPVAGKHAAPKGEWFWEYSDNDLNQIDDAETIRDHMLRAIFGSFANAKKNPKYAPNRLKWVAYVGVSVNPED